MQRHNIGRACRKEGIAQGAYYKWSGPQATVGQGFYEGWQAQACRVISTNQMEAAFY
jgi:hypothetical protein